MRNNALKTSKSSFLTRNLTCSGAGAACRAAPCFSDTAWDGSAVPRVFSFLGFLAEGPGSGFVASSVVSHERSDTWFAGAGSDATATQLGVRASVPGEGARKDPFAELGT